MSQLVSIATTLPFIVIELICPTFWTNRFVTTKQQYHFRVVIANVAL